MAIMKERMFLLTLLISTSMLSVFSQEQFTKFSFSGYKVHIIPSKTYALITKDNVGATKEVIDGILEISIDDQTGSMPKDEIYLFVHRLDYLYLHNSILVSDEILKCDSLSLEMASSKGLLTVDANSLSINAGGGTTCTLKGKTNYLYCVVGGASSISAEDLFAEEADLDVIGYSLLIVNAKNIKNNNIKDSSFKNILE